MKTPKGVHGSVVRGPLRFAVKMHLEGISPETENFSFISPANNYSNFFVMCYKIRL